ncbi:hypothetical protein HYFRA_00002940 [Hymenoscyphus fraxineus]|uniref:Aminomethyltransferase n=1 Tax=Hymenoscyphus fraxineus TaxID=746836 RepID=A0A9N9KMZ0_9HELO|nr:hypothetical protein HYFRA_00002940 [Hymenoscyphus fraxineus]
MKRVRAVQSFSEAIAIRNQLPRHSRLLSTAIIARTATPQSTPQPSPSSRFPSRTTTTALRHASTAPAATETLQKTPLYDLHVAHGGKMVPFGGFHMPVQYDSLSVSASHHFTRSHASLFDVSHMVQHHFTGADAQKFLERITPAGLEELGVHRSTLSTLLLPGTGGIVDDTIITKLGEEAFYVVTNAGCREKDLKYLNEQLEEFKKDGNKGIEWQVMDGWGLVALQGPLSEAILTHILAEPKDYKFGDVTNLKELYFGESAFIQIKLHTGELSLPLLVSRGGYTGEDGFEISISPEQTVVVTETLLRSAGPEKLQLAGLGARDSLRLEAGMCLYGHDLDESVTPVEAALSWTIGKSRKSQTPPTFHGASTILSQLTPKSKGGQGVERRRIGLVVNGAPAREGAVILNTEGEQIGNVTSGCPSPSLSKNIAMGYIKDGFHKSGTEVEVVVRGKKRPAVVAKMPFVASKYWKRP